jgi:hypothetical protein
MVYLKKIVTQAIPGTEIYALYWVTPRTEVLFVLLRLLPVTEMPPLWRWEKIPPRKLALLPPHFQIIPKISDSLLIFPCLFPTFLGKMFSRDYGDGPYGSCLSEIPFKESTFRLTSARLLGDSIPLEEQSKTEFHTRNR